MNDFLDHLGEYRRELPRMILTRCATYRQRCLDLAQSMPFSLRAIQLGILAEHFDIICVNLWFNGNMLEQIELSVNDFNETVEALNNLLLEEAIEIHFNK